VFFSNQLLILSSHPFTFKFYPDDIVVIRYLTYPVSSRS
jgi:hypothetical protein